MWIVTDRVVQILDLVAQCTVNFVWVKLVGALFRLKHFPQRPLPKWLSNAIHPARQPGCTQTLLNGSGCDGYLFQGPIRASGRLTSQRSEIAVPHRRVAGTILHLARKLSAPAPLKC
jgi:hypothetical protein